MEIVAGPGDAVVVETVVHVDAGDEEETRRLLAEMAWVAEPDRGGGWALSYPAAGAIDSP